MTHKIFILGLFLALAGCKQQAENVGENPQVSPTKNAIATTDKYLSKVYDLSQIQGIWQGERDINQSESYRIISDNNVLDITCIEGDCSEEGLFIEFGTIGFTNNKNLTNIDEQNLGKYLVYQTYNPDLKKNIIRIDEDFQFDDSLKLLETSLVSSYMLDEEDANKSSSFVRIKSLPLVLFKTLKDLSKQNNDLKKNFNLYDLSSKVIAKTDKCYFYKDRDLKVKQRAFLIQNDKAYLEAINDQSVKVYFDGKIVTSGYLNKSDIELLLK